MTAEQAVPILARWIAELRVENASLHREIDWYRTTNGRLAARARKLERVAGLAANPMRRYWIDRYTPEQATHLARSLDEVA